MERVKINTGLDGFVCIDRVLSLDHEGIRTSFRIPQNNNFTVMEAMAQSCALHLRYLTNLERFVFLLKIKELNMPQINQNDFIIEGKLIANSDRAYSYRLAADNGIEKISSTMVFTADKFHDNTFEDKYKKHYKKVLQCLVKNSEER